MGLQLAPLATAWWVNSNYLARDDCGTKATNWASIEKPIYSFTWPSPYNSLSFLVPIGLKAEAARMAMAHGTLPAASVPIHTNLAPLTWAMTIHSVLPLFMLIFLKYRLDFRNYISKRKKKKQWQHSNNLFWNSLSWFFHRTILSNISKIQNLKCPWFYGLFTVPSARLSGSTGDLNILQTILLFLLLSCGVSMH